MSTKRLLGIFAHPNDEELISGTLLHYHQLGVQTGLVYATRGEVGEFANSAIATPHNIGEIKEAETIAIADLLHVEKLWFLGYRDSGAPGDADSDHPHALVQANPAEVIGKLVAIIREFHPQVIITFDELGGNGHIDHIAIYKYTIGAFHAAADDFLYPQAGPAYSASKLYYASFSRHQALVMAEWLQDQAFENIFENVDISQAGLSDDQIQVVLNVEQWQETKTDAQAMHRTLSSPVMPISRLPRESQRKWRNTEYFQLATSRVGTDLPGDNDLFAHVQ
jgi:LmbE family N-acetylglucosaminyl deacetylase